MDINKIRKDFPILNQKVNGNPLVYLDNAATTQKPLAVIQRISDYYLKENSNVHRGVHHLSQMATEAYENARRFVADFIHAEESKEIIFTRGTTESINLLATVFIPFLQAGDEIVVSGMEHHSNMVPCPKVNVLSLNGGLIRNEITDLMNGDEAWSDIRGLYLMDQQQHIDNQIFVYHNMPHCNSNQLFKGILDNEATGVFNGYIYVARGAQQTNAFQRNSNILLTKTAHVDTMPHLEIYADDVKCSHGASVGQLDNEALFYLMQRGIPFDDARMLLLYAFADAIIKEISIEALRISIEDMVKRRLRGNLSICDRCVLHCSNPDTPVIFDIDLSKI